LQNAVTFGDDPARGVEHRTVQRMGHRADKLPGGLTRQLGVRVEGDDILDGRQDRNLPHDLREARARTAAQEGVEFHELSALAFVSHP